MNWIKSIVREVWELFVDDGALAIAILCWLLVLWLLPRAGLPAKWGGPLLFAGLAAILVESVMRFVRRQNKRP